MEAAQRVEGWVSEAKPRKKANRYRVQIRYEALDGSTLPALSVYMTKKAAETARKEFLLNGHPEAQVVEDAPPEERKVGRMTGT